MESILSPLGGQITVIKDFIIFKIIRLICDMHDIQLISTNNILWDFRYVFRVTKAKRKIMFPFNVKQNATFRKHHILSRILVKLLE